MKIEIDPEQLRPLIRECVNEAVELIGNDDRMVSAAKTAQLLDLSLESLRGERERNRIKAIQGPGKRIYYTPAAIREYIATRQDWSPATARH